MSLSLEEPANIAMGDFHNGPVADADGNVTYDYTYDLLNDDLFYSTVGGPLDYTSADLMPLDLREYVIHGAFLDDGSYRATLPVAAAEISPVPLPAGAALLLTGLAGFGIARRRRG